MTSFDPLNRRAEPTAFDADAVPGGIERRSPAPKLKNIPSPSDAARAGVYARFIPREELSSFSAWQPGDIDGGKPAQTHVHRTPEEPPKVDAAAQLAAQLRAARQSGYQDGYRDGLVALEGFKAGFATQMSAQIGALIASVGGELDGLQQEMARTLAVSATQLARQIVRSELVTRPDLVATVAHEALDTLLLSARHITLRVHPDDHALVAEGAAEVLAARGARLLCDPSLQRGGALVESDIGVIDATLEARWRHAAASLGIDADWAGKGPAGESPGDAASDSTDTHPRRR